MDRAITLVVPTRNAGPLFREALSSAIPQLRAGDEICVFDNQDEPGIEPGRIAAPCPVEVRVRERVLTMEESWSHALALGTRPWILWLHDDDLLAPGAVDALRSVAKDGDALVRGGHVSFGHVPPEWTNQQAPRLLERWPPDRAIAEYLFSAVHVCSGILFRRSALEAALPIPQGTGLACDRWLFQRVSAGGRTAVLSGVTVAYRRHAASTTDTQGSRLRWRRSLRGQRADAARLLMQRGVEPAMIAAVGRGHPDDVILDTMRSLVRGRSELAAPLAASFERVLPRLAHSVAWNRVRAGVRWGPVVLDVLGPVEWASRALRMRRAEA